MIQFLRQKVPTLIFIGLVSGLLVLMSHDVGNRGGTDLAEALIFKAGAPAVMAGATATSFVSDLFRNYLDLREVRAENRRLGEDLLRVEGERDRLRDLAAAAERLEGLLGLKRSIPGRSLAARVAGSGFASGSDTLLLDRGSSSGIAPGMPVLAVGGVVGRVIQVSPELSKVQCLTDRASGVAVVLQDTGYQGILVGRGRGSSEIQYLPGYAEVSPGDLAVTSGLDRIYPRGIPVGRIAGRMAGEGVTKRYEVRSLVDFTRILEVLVLTGPREGGERTDFPDPEGSKVLTPDPAPAGPGTAARPGGAS